MNATPSFRAPRTALIRRCALAFLLLPALAALGCSGDSKGKETVVTGEVTVNGAPAATGATVTFVGEGGKEASTSVGANGEYTMTNPPLGAVRIIVKGGAAPAPAAGPVPAGSEGMKAPAGAPVPPKYAQPNNGLTYTVVAGKQTHDIPLTP